MQIDWTTFTSSLSMLLSLGTLVFGFAVTREKVSSMEKRLDDLDNNYVRLKQFDFEASRDEKRIIEISQTLKETQNDVKKLLILVSKISPGIDKELFS